LNQKVGILQAPRPDLSIFITKHLVSNLNQKRKKRLRLASSITTNTKFVLLEVVQLKN